MPLPWSLAAHSWSQTRLRTSPAVEKYWRWFPELTVLSLRPSGRRALECALQVVLCGSLSLSGLSLILAGVSNSFSPGATSASLLPSKG